MATIILQTSDKKGPTPKNTPPTQTSATVASSPGRYHYATVNNKARTFERVGVDSSGNEVYRDQNRR